MSRSTLSLPSRSAAFSFGRDRDALGGGGGDDFDEDTGGGGEKAGSKGGSDEDDEDDEDDAGSDDSDDEDDDESTGVTKADGSPVTQDDWDKLQKSLRAARRDARSKGRNGGGDDKGGDDKDTPDADRIRAEVESEVAGAWKGRVVRTAAREALKDAGLIGKPDRLLRLIDLDEIDVDPEDDELDGLAEQVRELKKEYPHLFRKKGSRNLDAADKDSGRGRSRSGMSATEIQAAQLRGEL